MVITSNLRIFRLGALANAYLRLVFPSPASMVTGAT